MGTPAHRYEINLAPEFRINDRSSDHERVLGAALGHEAEAQTARDHSQDPIVALASVNDLAAGKAMLPPDWPGITVELAVDPVEVTLSCEILWLDRIM